MKLGIGDLKYEVGSSSLCLLSDGKVVSRLAIKDMLDVYENDGNVYIKMESNGMISKEFNFKEVVINDEVIKLVRLYRVNNNEKLLREVRNVIRVV